MRMVDPVLMEFDRECSTTKKLLERVPEDKLTWKPHPKSMSLGDLAWHVATIPQWIGSVVLADGHDLATGGMPKPPGNLAKTLEAFAEGVKTGKSALAQLDDAKAMGDWTLSNKGAVIMTLPRIGLVRTIMLNHTIHHRGQLSVYLRLLDVPVPSIYGPSADDNPFK